MKVEESRVQSSTESVKLLDKKMRTREYTHKKYIIILKDNTDFKDDEKVKIVNLEDFEKLGHILQDLREERIQLQKQVTILEDIKHDNETRINELEIQLQKQETITGKIKNII